MKYKILRPVEHNLKLYFPEGATAPDKAKSAGNAQEIAVDASGVLELSDAEAAQMREGQIEPVKSKPRVETQRAKEKE